MQARLPALALLGLRQVGKSSLFERRGLPYGRRAARGRKCLIAFGSTKRYHTFMNNRSFWIHRVESALQRRSLVWLAGVRRVGKTTLSRSLPHANIFDCELPRVREALEDAESFFRRHDAGALLVLDEVHRLSNPAEVLKIGTDHFPSLKIVATGSSTLAARRKFQDTLTGRKAEVWLAPVLPEELTSFFPALSSAEALSRRLLHGGLPPFLLSDRLHDDEFLEWMDSYWAKDIQELFVVEKRASFRKFIEMMLRQSGELFEATAFASVCEVSRQTIVNYLEILETTFVATVLRPYSGGSASELKSQPKVYDFDTGFVAWVKGWQDLPAEGRGILLEHVVLETLLSRWPRSSVHYWRNKARHEVDFVVKPGRGAEVHAIECKSVASKLDASGLRAFRRLHPHGRDVLVSFDALRVETRTIDGHEVIVTPVQELATVLEMTSPRSKFKSSLTEPPKRCLS